MGSTPVTPTPATPAAQPGGIYEVGWNLAAVSPPALVYITKDDGLLIQSMSSVSIGGVVTTRILLPNGRISYSQLTFTTNGTRIFEQFGFVLPEGFLLSLTVSATGSPVRGQWWATALLNRGFGVAANTVNSAQLAQGYIYLAHALAFPSVATGDRRDGGGNLRSITGTTPAAGAEISETVPTNAVWRLQSFLFLLTTSVAAANRQPHLTIDDGANVSFNKATLATQPASLTTRYVASPSGDLTQTDGTANIATPAHPLILSAGYRIRTATTALQAADQYTAPQYVVEEYLI